MKLVHEQTESVIKTTKRLGAGPSTLRLRRKQFLIVPHSRGRPLVAGELLVPLASALTRQCGATLACWIKVSTAIATQSSRVIPEVASQKGINSCNRNPDEGSRDYE